MDTEFVQLFQQEADTRLTSLGEHILELESSGDPELVQQLFRDAHSIKGAAAMVGFTDVSRVAHRLEDILDELRNGKRSPDPALIDVVLKATDALRELIAAAMAGMDASTQADAAEAGLREFSGSVEPESASLHPNRRSVRPTSGGQAARPTASADEAIAVPVERLDELV